MVLAACVVGYLCRLSFACRKLRRQRHLEPPDLCWVVSFSAASYDCLRGICCRRCCRDLRGGADLNPRRRKTGNVRYHRAGDDISLSLSRTSVLSDYDSNSAHLLARRSLQERQQAGTGAQQNHRRGVELAVVHADGGGGIVRAPLADAATNKKERK